MVLADISHAIDEVLLDVERRAGPFTPERRIGTHQFLPATPGLVERSNPAIDTQLDPRLLHIATRDIEQHALKLALRTLSERLAGTLSERQREELIESAQRGLLHARSAPIWDPLASDGMRPLSAMEQHERDAAIERYEDLLAVCLGEIK